MNLILTKPERIFVTIYCLLLFFELFTGASEALTNLHYVAKPALLISLIFFFYKQSKHLKTQTKTLMLLALLFSLLGDILLMFVDSSEHFFTGGLIAFLLAHITYSICFFRNKRKTRLGLFPIILVAYAITIFSLLKNNLGAMLIPVAVYMLVILLMAIFAHLRDKTIMQSYYLVLIGALLFLVSDSILAINKFYSPLYLSNISIMVTYAFAQLFITLGVLKQKT